MDCKTLKIGTFTLVYAIIVSSYASGSEVCKVVSENELQFFRNNESFIVQCIYQFPRTIKAIRIDSCNIKTFDSILAARWSFQGLENLTILNSKLEKWTVGRSTLPNLKHLNLAGNNLKALTMEYMSAILSLNVSNNWLSDINLDLIYLQELDVSLNRLETFEIHVNGPRIINLSGSFAPRKSRTRKVNGRISISRTVDLMDLSNNNLTDIGFLQVYGHLKSLSLNNNSFTNLSGLQILPSNTNVSLVDNPLHCSMKLTKDWLNMMILNIVFNDDLKCSFSKSGNRYSVNAYGLAFKDEANVINAEWAVSMSNTYMRFSAMNVWVVAFKDRLRLGWTSLNQTFGGVLILKSRNDDELYKTNVTFDRHGTFKDVYFNRMRDVTRACLLASVYNLTLKGRELVYVPVYCHNTTLVDIGVGSYRNSLTVVIVIFVLYLIMSICLVGYIYYSKLRRSVQPQSNTMELKTYATATSKTTNFPNPPDYQSDYVVNSHESMAIGKEYYLESVANGGFYTIKPNHLYMDMDSRDPYCSSGPQRVYDRVNSRACRNMSLASCQTIDRDIIEDIYDS